MKLLTFKERKALERMSLNDLNRWVLTLYKSGYECALEELGITESTEAVILDEQKLYNIIYSILGKPRVSQKIVDAIIKNENI